MTRLPEFHHQHKHSYYSYQIIKIEGKYKSQKKKSKIQITKKEIKNTNHKKEIKNTNHKKEIKNTNHKKEIKKMWCNTHFLFKMITKYLIIQYHDKLLYE